MKRQKGWPHNTIIDNMLNLELLFWAAKNGGKKLLYDIALSHAEMTARNQFRDDYAPATSWSMIQSAGNGSAN